MLQVTDKIPQAGSGRVCVAMHCMHFAVGARGMSAFEFVDTSSCEDARCEELYCERDKIGAASGLHSYRYHTAL